jgi:hypothetical protein
MYNYHETRNITGGNKLREVIHAISFEFFEIEYISSVRHIRVTNQNIRGEDLSNSKLSNNLS